ncbi:MAG: MAPEG family protein [Porticoccaceae bacterium]
MTTTLNPALFALAGFAGWTALLAVFLVGVRLFNAFAGAKIPLNRFSPGGDDLPGFGQRYTRAHLNCLEVLPIFAAVVIAAGLSNQLAIMESTAMYILYARIAQSVIHMISTALPMVLLRGTFFFIQLALLLCYVYQMLCR